MEKILIHVVPPYPNIVYKNIHRQAIIRIWFHRYLKVCQAVDALRAGSTQQHEWFSVNSASCDLRLRGYSNSTTIQVMVTIADTSLNWEEHCLGYK